MAHIGVLPFRSTSIPTWWAVASSCTFIRIVIIIIKEGSGRGGCRLPSCLLKFTVKGILLATTVKVPREKEDDAETDESDDGEYACYCWCVFEKSMLGRSDLDVQWIKIEGGKELSRS